MDTRLTVEELAKRWRCSLDKLYQWRSRGLGIKHHKEGKIIYYKLKDIEEFEASNWAVLPIPYDEQ